MSQFHTLNIKDITRQTDQCVSITFDVPDHLKEDYKFKAGQYITLKTDIDGKEVRRDYSLCTSPSSGNLTVAVKEVENGTFSKYANQVLKVGDTLDVAQPQGRFTFTPDTSKTRTIAAFTAGSGITPVLSILKTVLEEEPNSKFVLVYGNKTLKDTIFLNDLLDIQNKYSDRLSIQFLYSQSQEKDALFGRIEKSTVNFIVKNKYKDVNIDAFYICGPEGMINTVKDVLAENNIEDNKVFFELFTTTSSVSVEDLEEVTDGTTSITVIVDDEEKTFTMSQQQSVLEAALEQDLDAPYSCQGGICSSCLARVKEGKATMRQNNILTDNEVAEGLILTCQAHPVSAKIIVDYDDI